MSLLYHILNALFPRLCFNCGNIIKKDGPLLCAQCFSKITIYQTLFCSVCNARLPENKKICHKNSLYILGSITRYADPVKKLIWKLKYNKKVLAAEPLKKIITAYLDNFNLEIFKNFNIVPIPLHPQKEKERGFNQTLIIAKIIQERINIPILENILIKNKNTLPQMKLKNFKQRTENITDSFIIKNSQNIAGKNILLVDDVTTTGSTLIEASKTLKSAGAKKIIAITIAKTA